MSTKLIGITEVDSLKDCLVELAEHHNTVSLNFKGDFPKQPIGTTLAEFKKEITEETADIYAVIDNETVAGFCKIHFTGKFGSMDYLIVKKKYRKLGYGKILMDRAMQEFKQRDIEHIEIRVVIGNNIQKFYENYGFKPKSIILAK
jgi:ribosomal protein S18 acetylase RimI-like enzyme